MIRSGPGVSSFQRVARREGRHLVWYRRNQARVDEIRPTPPFPDPSYFEVIGLIACEVVCPTGVRGELRKSDHATCQIQDVHELCDETLAFATECQMC